MSNPDEANYSLQLSNGNILCCYAYAKAESCHSTEEDIAYHKLVVEKMIHKCHGGDNGCIDEDTGLCKKKFNYILNNETHFDEKKYPVYKRLKHEDCKVVVHNRQMLLDLKCHCNTEFSASTYSVIYLYKFLLV